MWQDLDHVFNRRSCSEACSISHSRGGRQGQSPPTQLSHRAQSAAAGVRSSAVTSTESDRPRAPAGARRRLPAAGPGPRPVTPTACHETARQEPRQQPHQTNHAMALERIPSARWKETRDSYHPVHTDLETEASVVRTLWADRPETVLTQQDALMAKLRVWESLGVSEDAT